MSQEYVIVPENMDVLFRITKNKPVKPMTARMMVMEGGGGGMSKGHWS